MGSLLTMATTGELEVDYREYGSPYRDEAASPGYYAVTLGKYGIPGRSHGHGPHVGRTLYVSGRQG